MFDLNRIGGISVGLLGDLAVDVYWYADMRKSELSRETPHFPLPVVREKMSLGAGGNVAANIAALKPRSLFVCGVRGDDWRGEILSSLLEEIGADVSGLTTEKGRFTQAYCKPMRMGISDVVYEDPRLDFAPSAPPAERTEEAILAWLDRIDGQIDVLCVCDQFPNGAVTDRVLARLCRMKTPVMADSRCRIGAFAVNGVLKPNEDECGGALRSLGLEVSDDREAMARALAAHTGAAVLLTLGERGSLFCPAASGPCVVTPAVKVEGPVDICGAGDTTLAAFACCTAAGASPAEAARIASAASAVTVGRIGTTGTASREEIEAVLRADAGGR